MLPQDGLHLLERLVNHVDGLIYCNLYDEYWTMVFVSAGCKSLTGYEPSDIMFNHLISYEEIIYAADRDRVRSHIEDAVKRHSRFSLEYRIQHADGNLLWVHESGNVVFSDDGKPVALEGLVQNINKQKSIEMSLLDAESRYRSIIENAVEGIFQTTPSGQYIMVNPALAKIYGFDTPQELMQALNNVQEQLYVDHGRRADFIEAIERYKKVKNFESLVYKNGGSTIWISENARAVYDEHGKLLRYEGTVIDITERKNHDSQLEYQATHDSLTGLPNRYILNDRLQQCINYADRYKNKMAVVFLDLDHFKHINDTMGHDVGDQLLLIMSQRLSASVRDIDTVVRLGGDEFVLLLANVQGQDDILPVMQRILSAVAEPCVINEMDFLVTSSIGVSLYPDDSRDSTKLLINADSAMYHAKKHGRNNFHIYTPSINIELNERVMLEYKLRLAIENNEFLLHYQPKVDFSTGLIIGVEALIRWQPPDEELIPPVRFIQIAEESGLIEAIGLWVLREACYKAKEIRQNTGYTIPIAVNVSPYQFKKANFVETVRQILAETQLDPSCLELEITENTLIDDAEKFIEILHSLKGMGVKLAIDDFGTGYSSLAYLKDFPVDRLKIDKAFVSNLENDAANEAILKTIVILGQSLGKKVVAEGVETSYQYDYLKAIGCDELQGYYFSKPIPASALEALLVINKQPQGGNLLVFPKV